MSDDGQNVTEPQDPERVGPLEHPRHERFCQEYLIDLNCTKAYLRAGYKVTANVARSAGSRLLTNVGVQARIEELQQDRATRTGITADSVLEELAILKSSNVRHFVVGEDGEIALAPGVPESAWRAVSGLKVKRRVIPQKQGEAIHEIETDFKLWDKPKTLQLAGQHLGLYKERVEHTGPDGGVLRVMAMTKDEWAAQAQAQQAAQPDDSRRDS
ncbi:MAG TPA: terminase small subunit [Gemmatimonadales bacterium]|nr:terminase small subunit [Gemmatimonadales bacterium]